MGKVTGENKINNNKIPEKNFRITNEEVKLGKKTSKKEFQINAKDNN